uniref:Uncharacterized protein n=1 Tax=Haplochromis burtoni TaxID=8153 RepID=A0A3Q2X4Y5_HAPBU
TAEMLDQEKLSCSICLQLLKHPVTIPCGHSYCMDCIKNYWDEKETHSCPQCREIFTPRPVLVKNTMLAELVEDLKKVEHLTASPDHAYAGPGDVKETHSCPQCRQTFKSQPVLVKNIILGELVKDLKAGLTSASSGHAYAGPGDMACDFCSGRKRKASKSCLVCMASYCEQHLQPHYNIAPLKKHKLINDASKLQENFCSRHDEVMKIFCRTDQQCICFLCLMDEHKDHVTVSAAVERAEKQKDLETNRQNVQQRIQNREKDVKVLQEEDWSIAEPLCES